MFLPFSFQSSKKAIFLWSLLSEIFLISSFKFIWSRSSFSCAIFINPSCFSLKFPNFRRWVSRFTVFWGLFISSTRFSKKVPSRRSNCSLGGRIFFRGVTVLYFPVLENINTSAGLFTFSRAFFLKKNFEFFFLKKFFLIFCCKTFCCFVMKIVLF